MVAMHWQLARSLLSLFNKNAFLGKRGKAVFKVSSKTSVLIVLGAMIVGILVAIVIPMQKANVNRTRMQEAVDTIGAIKDECSNLSSDTRALPPAPLDEAGILANLGVAVPQSTGSGGGRKWTYRVVIPGGNYFCLATAGVASDIGSVMAGNSVWVEGVWDGANREFTDWQWGAITAQMQRWLPR
jgi:type II secretory pathway pseudopilin PulG